MEKTSELPEKIIRLEQVQQLPTLPAVIVNLQAAVRDPNTDARRVARIIEDDPAIMARVLKVVNSAFYGPPATPVNSLQLAVARLGMRAVSNLALTTSVFSVFGDEDHDLFSKEQFWRHCICTGIVVNILCERCQEHLNHRYSRDVLHLAGLLHDMGKILLIQHLTEDFLEALRRSKEQSCTLFEAEREILGCDHAQVGAWLGMKWNLSTEILQTIRWHHDPEQADVDGRELALLCHSANYICNIEQIGDGGDLTAPSFMQTVWRRLGLSVADVSDIVDQVMEESRNSEILLALA